MGGVSHGHPCTSAAALSFPAQPRLWRHVGWWKLTLIALTWESLGIVQSLDWMNLYYFSGKLHSPGWAPGWQGQVQAASGVQTLSTSVCTLRTVLLQPSQGNGYLVAPVKVLIAQPWCPFKTFLLASCSSKLSQFPASLSFTVILVKSVHTASPPFPLILADCPCLKPQQRDQGSYRLNYFQQPILFASPLNAPCIPDSASSTGRHCLLSWGPVGTYFAHTGLWFFL